MLVSFKVKNFWSIKDWQEISWQINPKDRLDNNSLSLDKNYQPTNDKENAHIHLNLINCIIGANASGKSNILRALGLFLHIIQNSYLKGNYQELILNPHELSKNKLTEFEFEFIDKGKYYIYEFKTMQNKYITHEVLYEKIHRKNLIFSLTRHDDGTNPVLKTKLKINEADKKRFMESHNFSMLSALMNTGYLKIQLLVFNNIAKNLSPITPEEQLSNIINREETFVGKSKEKLLNLLQHVDFHIKNIITTAENKIFFDHGDFLIKFDHESNGTKQSIAIINVILFLFKNGGAFMADEIEIAIHPNILRILIKLFADRELNPNNAQIIFTTHQHLLLQDYHKSQIFLAEKNSESHGTEIYRLDDIKGVRESENFLEEYLAGSYGAVPQIRRLKTDG